MAQRIYHGVLELGSLQGRAVKEAGEYYRRHRSHNFCFPKAVIRALSLFLTSLLQAVQTGLTEAAQTNPVCIGRLAEMDIPPADVLPRCLGLAWH
jgi:hypothetical protein